MRAHQVPRSVDVLIDGAPEKVGAAHRREHIVCLHPVVAVIGTELQKLRDILVPYVQVHGYRTLPHSQLIDGDSGIVCKLYPADDPACRPLKAADGCADCPHLAEVQPHAAAEF